MPDLIVAVILSLLVGAGGGTAFGLKLRGWIPLRAPSNSVRLANAKTDTEIAELYVERRKHELEAEYVEIKGRKQIEEEREEIKQLTTAEKAASSLDYSDAMFHALSRFMQRKSRIEIPGYLRQAVVTYGRHREFPTFLYERTYDA
jgi:hypothetical protein